MKKILSALFILSVFSISTLSAFSFEQACEVLNTNKITNGNFIQKRTVNASKRVLKAEGNFVVCHKGIIWALSKPVKGTTIITKEKIAQIDKNGTVNILGAEQSQIFSLISEIMTSLFNGNQNQLNQHFHIVYEELVQSAGNNNSLWKMTLSPKDGTISSAVASIELSGNTTVMTIMKLNLASGDSLLYEFLNHSFADTLTTEQEEFFAAE